MQIGISGAGSAGLMSAVLLAEEGAEVTVFDQAEVIKPVGAGFLLQPTGMEVLKRVGILEEVLSDAARVDRLYCKTGKGRVLLDLQYREVGGDDFYGAGTHRATFMEVLTRRAEVAGVAIRRGVRVEQITRSGTNGRRYLEDDQGVLWGAFDFVLVCDGARSQLRNSCGIESRVSRYPWGALWFIGRRTKEFDTKTLWQVVSSTTQLGGFLPTGTDNDLLSFFWSVRMKDLPALKEHGLDRLKGEVIQLIPEAEGFLDQLVNYEQLQSAGYFDVRMKRWAGEGIAILGDAAHALSPQLGQGVNLALMDASVLVDSLLEAPLDEALVNFSYRRKKHLDFYQRATRWSTPFFQSDKKILGLIRDTVFPLSCCSSWARKEMSKTMAGMKTGPFSQLKLK